jgi:hypothetical protein
MKKMFNEGNQIHNFMSSSGSGSDFLTSYGSGSTSQKVTVPTVPVPQHCSRQSCRLPDSPMRGVVFPLRISPRIRIRIRPTVLIRSAIENSFMLNIVFAERYDWYCKGPMPRFMQTRWKNRFIAITL